MCIFSDILFKMPESVLQSIFVFNIKQHYDRNYKLLGTLFLDIKISKNGKGFSFPFFKNLLPFTTLKISVISELICRFCSPHHRTRFEVSNNLKLYRVGELLYGIFQSEDAFLTII